MKAPGLSITGNIAAGEDAVLQFGAEQATAVLLKTATSRDEGVVELDLKRGGVTQASFNPSVARFPHTLMEANLSVDTLAANHLKQWALWDLDTFDVLNGAGQWSTNDHSFCSTPTDQFLGGHCKLGAAQINRRYVALPPHARIRVKARVHFLDKWEGEMVAMRLDGQTVWSQSHDWCPGFQKWMCEKYGMNTCGAETPDRLSVKAEVVLPHRNPSVDVSFTSSLALGTDPCATSWGVDDVSIELL